MVPLCCCCLCFCTVSSRTTYEVLYLTKKMENNYTLNVFTKYSNYVTYLVLQIIRCRHDKRVYYVTKKVQLLYIG